MNIDVKHIITMFALVLLFSGVAVADDYYVSTTGDDGASGDLTHPWQNVSYATSQATAGDAVHLFDGTWWDEENMFTNNGTPGNPVVLTAYNGTPTLASTQVDTTAIHTWYVGSFGTREYITISDITITDYHSAIYIRKDNHIVVENVTVNIRSKADGNHAGIAVYDGSDNVVVDGCTIRGDGWNSLGISGRYLSGIWSQQPSTNITFKNNEISMNTWHNLIDIKGNVSDIDIIGNTLHSCDYNGFYTHQGFPTRVNFSNNLIYNLSLNGVSLYHGVDCILQNNTMYDVLYGARGYESENITYRLNTIHDSPGNGIYHYNTSVSEQNNIYNTTGTAYRFSYGVNTLRDPLIYGTMRCTISSAADEIIEYTDGKAFAITHMSGANFTYVSPRWYPDMGKSTIVTDGPETVIITMEHYNITLKPTSDYLHTLTMNHESDATDDRTNIAILSSVPTNPTWINATMQNASHNYSVSVDSVIVGYVDSDSGGVVRYQYASSWGTPTFEFDWVSSNFAVDYMKAYFNSLSPISVTATGYGSFLNVFNRTITEADTECAFGMDVVV